MIAVNFLPWRDQKRRCYHYHIYSLALCIFCLCIAVIVFCRFSIASRISALHVKIVRLENRVHTHQTGLTHKNVIFLSRIVKNRETALPHLFAVTKAIPRKAYLTAMSRNNRRWKMEGLTLSSDQVDTFIRDLAESKRFRRIRLTQLNKEKFIHFIVECHDEN